MNGTGERLMDLVHTLQIAREHHEAGRLPQAERLYRQVLQFDPNHAEALHLLGMIALQVGSYGAAIELLEKAVEQRPLEPEFLAHLADAYRAQRNFEGTERCFRALLNVVSDRPDPCFGLADALTELGQFGEAEHWYRRGIDFDPARPIPRYNLGNALRGLGRLEEAARSYADAVALKPDFAEARYNLANVLKEIGNLDQAEIEYQQLIALKPDYVEAHNNRGTVLADLGRLAEAAASYRRAIALKPDHANAYNNLGNVFRELGQHEEAERYYSHTVALKPGLAEALNHHGNALLDLGRLDEAEKCYRRAIELAPNLSTAYSNLLLLQNYLPDRRQDGIGADALEFGRRFGQCPGNGMHRNRRDKSRKLRIGYVSGDFRVHSVAFFIEPVLAAHDRSAFEIFCYYNFPRAESITRRLRGHADHWRDVFVLDDNELDARIRRDEIDVLVDLSGHTAGNRLPVFGRRPAPVQVSYLGYPATSGLPVMDYRLTDEIADPPGESDRMYAERLVRLPRAMWCFRADESLASGGSAERSGCAVTFGSFNYFAKLNSNVFALWARILERLPATRLVVTRIPGEETAATLKRHFEKLGVASNRLELHGILPRMQLGEIFSRVDIALDPFPYAGTTTTCEVMWMGIPVVTLSGATTASRSGASLLRSVGLESLIAHSTNGYLDIAESLARDPVRLAMLRGELRDRMRSSTLMDDKAFTRSLEDAYRAMWRAWCSGAGV
jgi:predicted O-linked N-acetylglucosamine transferase (SPINDLY family)